MGEHHGKTQLSKTQAGAARRRAAPKRMPGCRVKGTEMLRIFIDESQMEKDKIFVRGADANHIRQVLRMKEGEDFEAVDESGRVLTCRISGFEEDAVAAEILFAEEAGAELPNQITLYMGLPKFDKMELIIQKAVELGVGKIVPVAMRRCVVKFDEKKAKAKTERWQQIARSAAEQSKRAAVPEVGEVLSFDAAMAEAEKSDHILFPYEEAKDIRATRACLSKIKSGQSVALFIGPEGGFDPAEVAAAKRAGAQIITLGRRILRTETAAIAALSILMYLLEEI